MIDETGVKNIFYSLSRGDIRFFFSEKTADFIYKTKNIEVVCKAHTWGQ